MRFDLIERAGITQGQFAELAGVSRITVNTWVKGRYGPRADLRTRVVRLLGLITEALRTGALPVTTTSQRAATAKVLERMRRQMSDES